MKTPPKYSKGSLYAANPESTMVLYILQEGYCNSVCGHCYMKLQKQKPKFRDVKTARKDLTSLVSQRYNVHLRGTEILLNREYLELFRLVGQEYIQTNGKLLCENHSLPSGLKRAGINRIMLTYPTEPSGLLDFSEEMVDNAIRIGSSNDFRMVVDFILTRNILESYRREKKYFESICEHLINLGVHELRFVRLIPFTEELKKLSLSPSETEDMVKESVRLEVFYKGRLDVTRSGQMGFFDLRRALKKEFLEIDVPAPEDSGIMDCPAGKKLFVIDMDNSAFPCLYLMSLPHKIGSFRDGKIDLIGGAEVPGRLHISDCPAYTENYNKY